MKKKIACILCLLLIICVPTTVVCLAESTTDNPVSLDDNARLQKVIMTLVMPEVEKAVNNYYSEYLTDLPIVAAFLPSSKISDLKTNDGNSTYQITVEVFPYIGPHNAVGADRILLYIDASGNVEVKRYEHIKTYDLAPNYKDILKKPFPQS